MTGQDTSARLARYLGCLSSVTGSEPSLREVTSVDPGAGRVLAVVCTDVPGTGYVTGFSYGLSLSGEPAPGGRELVLTVRSRDAGWAMVPARMVAALCGRHSFERGRALGHAGRLAEDTAMTSVLLAEPPIRRLTEPLDLGSGDSAPDGLEIVGVYPIYASERDLVHAAGFDALWSLDWDRFDPARPPVA
ncbi:suppressor of fused domain protein [Actinoallomurus acaciae]|uniref:Suppressor of fused domain protein n=1 Tax=Actinoallomurus acaciae TaxID=502577 RepID=A0ABV5YJV1_9ACTN